MAIQGIFGPIDPAELGQTLIHEHLTCADWSMRMNFGGKFFDFDQVAAMAEGQLNKAKALGVRTVVDGTPINLGRDIHLIRGGVPAHRPELHRLHRLLLSGGALAGHAG